MTKTAKENRIQSNSTQVNSTISNPNTHVLKNLQAPLQSNQNPSNAIAEDDIDDDNDDGRVLGNSITKNKKIKPDKTNATSASDDDMISDDEEKEEVKTMNTEEEEKEEAADEILADTKMSEDVEVPTKEASDSIAISDGEEEDDNTDEDVKSKIKFKDVANTSNDDMNSGGEEEEEATVADLDDDEEEEVSINTNGTNASNEEDDFEEEEEEEEADDTSECKTEEEEEEEEAINTKKKTPNSSGSHVTVFDPQEHDVVSTKLRSWNLRHPGNLAYADLLAEYASKLPSTTDPNYSSTISEITKALIKLITEEKGGRFLKIQGRENHPNDCIVMNYKEARHKALQGLKNKQRVILTKGIPTTKAQPMGIDSITLKEAANKEEEEDDEEEEDLKPLTKEEDMQKYLTKHTDWNEDDIKDPNYDNMITDFNATKKPTKTSSYNSTTARKINFEEPEEVKHKEPESKATKIKETIQEKIDLGPYLTKAKAMIRQKLKADKTDTVTIKKSRTKPIEIGGLKWNKFMSLEEPIYKTEDEKPSKKSTNANTTKTTKKSKTTTTIKIKKTYKKAFIPPTERKTRGQLAQEDNNPPPPGETKDQEDSDAVIEEAVDYDRMPELDNGPKETKNQNDMEVEENEEAEDEKTEEMQTEEEMEEDTDEERDDRSSTMGDEEEESLNEEEEEKQDNWDERGDESESEATTWKKKLSKREVKKTRYKVTSSEPQGTFGKAYQAAGKLFTWNKKTTQDLEPTYDSDSSINTQTTAPISNSTQFKNPYHKDSDQTKQKYPGFGRGGGIDVSQYNGLGMPPYRFIQDAKGQGRGRGCSMDPSTRGISTAGRGAIQQTANPVIPFKQTPSILPEVELTAISEQDPTSNITGFHFCTTNQDRDIIDTLRAFTRSLSTHDMVLNCRKEESSATSAFIVTNRLDEKKHRPKMVKILLRCRNRNQHRFKSHRSTQNIRSTVHQKLPLIQSNERHICVQIRNQRHGRVASKKMVHIRV